MDLSLAELALAMSLVGLDVIARVAPHAPNFTPVAASALFAGTGCEAGPWPWPSRLQRCS
jgi:hypothetical protein